MKRLTPKRDWFNNLKTVGLYEKYAWLKPFAPVVNLFVSIGAWSSEPFALLWILDAIEAMIVDIDPNQFSREMGLIEEIERLNQKDQRYLSGREIKHLVGDISKPINQLETDYYDLAFCKDVLYIMQENRKKVQDSIIEMKRIVKPGGLVIAVEPKFGVEYECIDLGLFEVPAPKVNSQAENMSNYFENAGLESQTLNNPPFAIYIYTNA